VIFRRHTYWAIFALGSFLKITNADNLFGLFFSTEKNQELVLTDM
jgi:hypothetical protein